VTDCAPRPPVEPLGDGAAAALLAGAAALLDGAAALLLELELVLELQPAAARVATAMAAIPA
jgi:hypothetical protein